MKVLSLFLLSLATCTIAVAQGPEGKNSQSKDVLMLKQPAMLRCGQLCLPIHE